MKIILETERLILREMVMDDLDEFAKMYADDDVMKFIGNGSTMSREETEQSIHVMLEKYYPKYGFGLWTTVLKSTNEVLGRCGLLYWEIEGAPETEIAYLLKRDAWGMGYGTEAARAIRDHAFKKFPAERVISLMYPDNKASENVALKNGMNFLKELEMFSTTVAMYGISREEWLAEEAGGEF
ncbi:MAG: GNAT family N-acetyltransferase [Bacteroidota bacterium]